jgi:hypothetical protein
MQTNIVGQLRNTKRNDQHIIILIENGKLNLSEL